MDASDQEGGLSKRLSLKNARLFTPRNYQSLYFALQARSAELPCDRHFVSLALSLCSLNSQNVSGRFALAAPRKIGVQSRLIKHIGGALTPDG
jgi:hypothetical protein